jgi:hypothetical protein
MSTVPLEEALREATAVAARMESGRLHRTSPFGLTYAIVSSIGRREADIVAGVAREVGLWEQRVMAEADEDPPGIGGSVAGRRATRDHAATRPLCCGWAAVFAGGEGEDRR